MTMPRGFTLLELLVVLAVLGLVTTFALPFFTGGRAGLELRGATRELTATLREARGLAIAHNEPTAVLFDSASGSYRLSASEKAHSLPRSTRLAVYRPGLGRDDGGEAAMIVFFADGGSSGGIVEIFRGQTRGAVAVDWLTGRVTAHE